MDWSKKNVDSMNRNGYWICLLIVVFGIFDYLNRSMSATTLILELLLGASIALPLKTGGFGKNALKFIFTLVVLVLLFLYW